jgi:DnaJ-class molecular chaperone
MKDPYHILGVAPTASAAEIKKAYLRLAKKHHPDLNPGDKHAEEQFKEISAANDLLSDPEKRRRFDAGEIDETGAERAQQKYYRDFAESAGHPYESASGYADFVEAGDILSQLLRRKAQEARRARGADLHYHLAIDFLDAINGVTQTITLPHGGTLEVAIPPGIEEGQVLRLRGKGAPSPGEGKTGDALVEISINPHRFFTRKGNDIYVDLPITLKEAALGAEVEAPTPAGKVLLKVPKGSNTGTALRLKGKGVAKRGGGSGDELVRLIVMMPTESEPELETFLSHWTPKSRYDPRKERQP